MSLSLSFHRLANCSLTVYNAYTDATTRSTVYQRTQIKNAQSTNCANWNDTKGANVSKIGLQDADQALITLPMEVDTNYLTPHAWQALVSKTGKWTLQVGDYIVKGLISDEIHDLIPAVTGPPAVSAVPAFTVTMLKAKYDNALRITSVDTLDRGRPAVRHWKVGGQ